MQFSYNPEATNMLWTVIDGELYCCDSDQFKKLKAVNSACDIPMKKIDKKFNEIEELKEYFKL